MLLQGVQRNLQNKLKKKESCEDFENQNLIYWNTTNEIDKI